MDTLERLMERDRGPASKQGRRSRSAVQGAGRRWPLGRRTALLAALCLTLLALLNAFVAQPFLVPSGSMENTLQVGDRMLVNKLAYRFGDQVERGDVIVFDGTGSFVREDAVPRTNPVTGFLRQAAALVGFARPGEADYTKRVVGVSGDRVTCCDERGRITVNGHPVDESGFLFPKDAPSQVPFDIVVPGGKLWVMGDHRGDSRDSRDHLGEPGGGTVPVDKVIGRADRVIWPLGRWQHLDRPEGYADVPDPGIPDARHG